MIDLSRGPFREPLRRDPRGWQIEDDDAAEATLATLEALGLVLAEMVLHRFADMGIASKATSSHLRGLAVVAGTTGMTRLQWLQGGRRDKPDNPMAGAAAERMQALMNWLLEWEIHNPEAPPKFRKPRPPGPAVVEAAGDLLASASYFYRRAANSGTTGGGRKRRMARNTTRRKA